VIAAGKLRHRLTLEQAATEADGSGGFATSWAEVATLWGAIEAIGGREFGMADTIKGEATHRITIRYRGGVGPAQRFTSEERVFEIRSVIDPDGRRRRLVCLCVERDLA
jgi:SPP1 family predicted phage head-tail adaptor